MATIVKANSSNPYREGSAIASFGGALPPSGNNRGLLQDIDWAHFNAVAENKFLYPDYYTGSDGIILGGITDGRLSLTTVTPVTTSDVLAATLVYFTPFRSNFISLYSAGNWVNCNFTEQSVAVPSTVFRLFDIFGYYTGSDLALETVNWDQTTGTITGATNATPIVITSASHGLSVNDLVGINSVGGTTAANGKIWTVSAADTNTFTLQSSVGNGAYTSGGTWYKINNTRATALTTQNGVYVKTGDATRKYLGTCMTTNTSGQTEDSRKRRFVWNAYNRERRDLLTLSDTASWVYSVATFRESNGDSSVGVSRFDYVCGLSLDKVFIEANMTTLVGVVAGNSTVGVGIDTSSTDSSYTHNGGANAGDYPFSFARYSGTPGIGYHSIRLLERGGGGSTTNTWYGNAAPGQNGMIGQVMS